MHFFWHGMVKSNQGEEMTKKYEVALTYVVKHYLIHHWMDGCIPQDLFYQVAVV